MKKKFVLCAALLALAFTGCEKTGTIEGVVLDPFTGKAVEMPTVWMDSTVFGTHAPKYAHKGILKEGKFKFEKVGDDWVQNTSAYDTWIEKYLIK